LNGTDNNLLLKFIKEAIEEKVPKGLIHPCPYGDPIRVYNLSLAANPVLNQFLKGSYKVFVRAFDEKDDNILSYKLKAEL
jgi:hypothetical protein